MQIEACLAAAVFKCSSLSNSDVRAVIEMIDPDMRGEGFVIGADFLGKLKRDQLDLVMAECGGEPAAKTAKKVEVVEYAELGMEAIWKIDVVDFPAFIVVDDKGNDFFAELMKPAPKDSLPLLA